MSRYWPHPERRKPPQRRRHTSDGDYADSQARGSSFFPLLRIFSFLHDVRSRESRKATHGSRNRNASSGGKSTSLSARNIGLLRCGSADLGEMFKGDETPMKRWRGITEVIDLYPIHALSLICSAFCAVLLFAPFLGVSGGAGWRGFLLIWRGSD